MLDFKMRIQRQTDGIHSTQNFCEFKALLLIENKNQKIFKLN